MRDTGPGLKPRLEYVTTLVNDRMVAVVYGPNQWGVSALWLNRWLMRGHETAPVLLWARRELAAGARVSWLLATDLDALTHAAQG